MEGTSRICDGRLGGQMLCGIVFQFVLQGCRGRRELYKGNDLPRLALRRPIAQ